jgi:signal transduction histidine kinase
VRDTGIGMPAERLGELFQPFNRIGAEHSVIEGAGVGLALTKQLVEKMSGRVGARSTEGQGLLLVRVPLAADEAPHRAPTIRSPARWPATARPAARCCTSRTTRPTSA